MHRHTRAWSAYIESTRGGLPGMLSTDAALADEVADYLCQRVGGQSCPFDTRRPHGPTQWLEPAPFVSPVPQHIQDRMFLPVVASRNERF